MRAGDEGLVIENYGESNHQCHVPELLLQQNP
jgi:hypothetical protein